MPQTVLQLPSLTSLISSVIAPVGLISTTAILLSGYSGKYGSISDQMRRLTAEYRAEATRATRRECVKRQLFLYHRRIRALWGASALLSLALLSFVGTVVAVMLSVRATRLGTIGLATLLLGLVLVASGIGLEMYEIGLSRLTTAGELADIFGEEAQKDPEKIPPERD